VITTVITPLTVLGKRRSKAVGLQRVEG